MKLSCKHYINKIMKHLRLFNNSSDFETAELIKPNVSLIKETGDLNYISNKIPQITYQIDCRTAPWEVAEMTLGAHCKYIKGDFSELYNTLIEFTKTYGINDDYGNYFIGETDSEIPLNNPKITFLVDDYNTGENKVYNLCWVQLDYNNYLNIGFDVPRTVHNLGGECWLSPSEFEILMQTYF